MAKIILQKQGEPITPNEGFATLYVDECDNNLKMKYDDGNIYNFTVPPFANYNSPILSGCVSTGGIGLKWSDPKIDNTCLKIIPAIQEWRDCTYIVRKDGALPSCIEDGTVLCVECCKNNYCNNWFVDTTACLGCTYGYRVFAKTKTGDYLYSDGYCVLNFAPLRYLVVGGGGPGVSSGYGTGGGGGGVTMCDCYCPTTLSTSVTIGQGGVHGNCYCTPGTAGGASYFGNIVARGGNTSGCGYSGNGYTPGASGCANGGGGAGAGANGANGNPTSYYSGSGGNGCMSNICGANTYYGGGGSGGSYNQVGAGGAGGGGTGNGGCATYYGGGGGGAGQSHNNSTNGYQGIVIVSHPVAEGYTSCGGDCVYCCNGSCIHVFTSNGTFCLLPND